LFAAGFTEDDLAGRGLAEDPAGVGPRLLFQRVPEGKFGEPRTARSDDLVGRPPSAAPSTSTGIYPQV
jgi:hypothetical protein